jgi:hypothetical protein
MLALARAGIYKRQPARSTFRLLTSASCLLAPASPLVTRKQPRQDERENRERSDQLRAPGSYMSGRFLVGSARRRVAGPRVSGTAHGFGSVLSVLSVACFDSNGPTTLFRISLTSCIIGPILPARMLRIPTDDILSDTQCLGAGRRSRGTIIRSLSDFRGRLRDSWAALLCARVACGLLSIR